MLTPVFKCSTNPRVATAHRWAAVDVITGMSKPIGNSFLVCLCRGRRMTTYYSIAECFYNKDGKWYYAGIYKAFQMEDLTTKEWEALSHEVRRRRYFFILQCQTLRIYRRLKLLSRTPSLAEKTHHLRTCTRPDSFTQQEL
jgi:hypothetical protein